VTLEYLLKGASRTKLFYPWLSPTPEKWLSKRGLKALSLRGLGVKET